MAQPGHVERARHGQRPRDGLVLAPSVSTGSAILCLQRGKGRFGGDRRVAPFIRDPCADPSDLPNPDALNAPRTSVGLWTLRGLRRDGT